MHKAVLVIVGGGFGALLRYGTGLLAARLFGTGFAWGTLIVNLSGCFVIGVCFESAERKGFLSPSARLFLVTGFLGALTTFSTYALETVTYAREGAAWPAVANVLANTVGGGLLVLVGMWLAWRLT